MLADLYPLLRTVQPADINLTLNAISTALEGRGEALGRDLVTVDRYLKRINPQIPQIVEDLRLTTKVANTYADVVPSIAQILRNTITTTGTLQDRHQQLQALFTDVSSFSDTAHDFLRQNGDNIIRLGQVSRPQAPDARPLRAGVPLPARRAGQRGQARGRRRSAASPSTSSSRRCRTSRAATPPPTGRCTPTTAARTASTCPNPPWSQSNPVRHQPNFKDGIDSPTGKGTDRVAPSYGRSFTRGTGYAGGPAEAGLLKSLLGPSLGRVAATTCPTSACCWSARWHAGRRCRCDEHPLTPLPHRDRRRARRRPRHLDAKTLSALVKLLIFMVVTALATSVLAIIIGNLSFGSTHTYQAEFVDATGLVKGDDVRIAGVKVGSVKGISIVDRTRAMVTFDVQSRHRADAVDPRRHPLPQPRRPALRRAHQRDRQHRRARARLDDPGLADVAGPRPDGALQRVQAAVPGAVAVRRQRAVLRDHPGLPGPGRHARTGCSRTRRPSPRPWRTATR